MQLLLVPFEAVFRIRNPDSDWGKNPGSESVKNESGSETLFLLSTSSNVKCAYLMFHSLGENVFVEAACEVSLQQLVVIDCLGNHSPHKFEVVQVVGVDVGEVVDCIGYPET